MKGFQEIFDSLALARYYHSNEDFILQLLQSLHFECDAWLQILIAIERSFVGVVEL